MRLLLSACRDKANFAGMIKIGVLREGKVPRDSRVVLTPQQVASLALANPDARFIVQPSEFRCYRNEEYSRLGIELQEDLSQCDVLLGVKEVPPAQLLPEKTYLFFSHTIKKQAQNRALLQTILQKKVQLIDWETLTDEQGRRVIAFGRWAGIVGAHNALWTWGKRSDAFHLPRAYEARDYAALLESYPRIAIPPVKILVSGGGRVAQGAEEVLKRAGIKKLSSEEFLQLKKPAKTVYAAVDCPDFYQRKDGEAFDWQHFFTNPDQYSSTFTPYWKATDLFINAIYWDPRAPRFFELEDLKSPEFRIRVIADITCDIDGSVPTTVKATTIAQPLFGTELLSGRMSASTFGGQVLTTMSIDNLPNELPRDASEAFGEQFSTVVWPELLNADQSAMIRKACIAKNGQLTPAYAHLQDYVDSKS